jgi:hypothetical protein
MNKTELTLDLIHRILSANSIKALYPLIVVFRNTAMTPTGDLIEVADQGTNFTDVTLACDSDGVRAIGAGRSYPHSHYLMEQEQGISNCNYVESQYQPEEWVLGNHLGYTGLIQIGTAVIHRTKDHVLGNADDYFCYGAEGRVGNNVHGYSPYSAGCTTIVGNMSKYPYTGQATGDWKAFEDWFAAKDKGTRYSALWLEYEDLTARKALRIGSEGDVVMQLQTALRIPADGKFGPQTFLTLRNMGLRDGIVTEQFASTIGVQL